jgi:hypothetical protein
VINEESIKSSLRSQGTLYGFEGHTDEWQSTDATC